MKVLYLVNIPSPYRVDFFNELGKLCDLTVLFENKGSIERKNSWLKKDFKNFKAVYLKNMKIKKNLWFSYEIIKYLKDESYDVIVIGGYSTLTGMIAINYLNVKRIPFVLNSDGGLIKNDNVLKLSLKKYFISSASYWLSTGKNTTKYLEEYGANNEKIFAYPFSSIKDEEVLKEKISNKDKYNLKNKLGINEEKVILSIGRFIPIKGFETLIKACNNLPDEWGVYIIGGNSTIEYEKLMEEMNLKNIYFLDFLPKESLKEYYLISDLFVLPTKGDIWGLVINEAMSYGLPVITTNMCVAGLELINEEENGFIIPVDNSLVLNDRIKYCLTNEDFMEKASRNNIMKIKSYTVEAMAIKHLEIFKSIVEKSLK